MTKSASTRFVTTGSGLQNAIAGVAPFREELMRLLKPSEIYALFMVTGLKTTRCERDKYMQIDREVFLNLDQMADIVGVGLITSPVYSDEEAIKALMYHRYYEQPSSLSCHGYGDRSRIHCVLAIVGENPSEYSGVIGMSIRDQTALRQIRATNNLDRFAKWVSVAYNISCRWILEDDSGYVRHVQVSVNNNRPRPELPVALLIIMQDFELYCSTRIWDTNCTAMFKESGYHVNSIS